MSGNLHMFRVGKDGDWTTLWVSLDHGGDGGIQIQLSSQWGAFAHYFDQPGKCTLAWLADCDDGYMERKLYASAVRCGVADRKAETAAARAIRAWPALVQCNAHHRRHVRGWGGGNVSNIVRIDMQSRTRALTMTGGHSHTCPECYEHVPCLDRCAVEPDLDLDDGTIRGAFVVCEPCEHSGNLNHIISEIHR